MIKRWCDESTTPWLCGSFCIARSPLWCKHALIGARSGGKCAGLRSVDNLSDPETAAVLQQAQEQPDLFVLKAHKEGGGNK